MVKRFVLTALACSCLPAGSADPDPVQIVERALELNRRNDPVVLAYRMTQERIKRDLGSDGQVKSTTAETFEVVPVEGEPLQRLIRRNGQPLSPDEARKAQEKFDEAVRERETETAERRRKRLAKYEEKLDERREMLDELPSAFTFVIEGEEAVDGYPAWRIQAKPRPGYQPKSMRSSVLTRMEGRFWISKEHNRLLKVDAVTTGPVSFGWVLAKLAPGTRISMEQMKLTDDVWVLKRFKMTYDVRIALVKQARGETEQIMWDFRRVGTPVRAADGRFTTGAPARVGRE